MQKRQLRMFSPIYRIYRSGPGNFFLRPLPHIVLSRLFTCSLSLLLAAPVIAREQVTGKYTSISGNTIVLQLSVASPPPANLIIVQDTGGGPNRIISTQPTAKKINPEKGKIKWLFRNMQPGNISLKVTCQNPVSGSPWAKIRYRKSGSGEFTERLITP
ncbi:MAG: hypothetical protein CSA81_02375 [Acidobacteria bacterium]|nr:MAG: hypothetical protein CSA81_02375 [Acidobacteriota bacterium]